MVPSATTSPTEASVSFPIGYFYQFSSNRFLSAVTSVTSQGVARRNA